MREQDLLLRSLLADYLVEPLDGVGDLVVFSALDAVYSLACLGAHVWPSSFGTEVQVRIEVRV